MTQVDRARSRVTEGFYAALADDDVQDLYDHAPCGYVSTTPDGTFVRVNETFLSWTGYTADELVGRQRFVDLLTPGGKIFHETHYAPLLQMQGSVRELALDIVCADGRRLPALVNSIIKHDHTGAPVAVRTAVFDATERRQYERELLVAKDRAEASEHLARQLVSTLQQVLIPPLPPAIPGLEVAADYRPAGTDVGGDFYDVFQIGSGDWAIAVGDVCGKGVDAAIVAALARHTTRAAAVGEPDPRQVLSILNEVLLHHPTDRFCTACFVRLVEGPGHWTATLSIGGHPPPVLVRHDEAPRLVGRHGTLLGMFDAPVLHDDPIVLRPGDALVFYTDGVTEGRLDGDMFGEDRLLDSLASPAPLRDLVHGVMQDVLAHQGGVPHDDVALIAVRVP